MAVEWTEEQKAIFDSHDKNILVSASAGSGKTTVMIQKMRLCGSRHCRMNIPGYCVMKSVSLKIH